MIPRSLVIGVGSLALFAACHNHSSAPSPVSFGWTTNDLGPTAAGSAGVATNPAGDALLVWVRGTQLIARGRSALGAFGVEQPLGDPGSDTSVGAVTLLDDGRAAVVLECDGLSASLRRAPNGMWTGPKLATTFVLPVVREARATSSGDMLVAQMTFVQNLGSQVLLVGRNDASFGDPAWVTTPITWGLSSSYGVFGSALGRQGLALVVWSQRLATSHVLSARLGTALVGFEPQEDVTTIEGAPMACAAAMDGQGRALVLLASRASGRSRLSAWIWTRALGWHGETLLRLTSADLHDLRVVADDSGCAFACWIEQGSDALDIAAARFEPADELWHEAAVIAPRAQLVTAQHASSQVHDLAVGADGSAIVIWVQRDADVAEVRVRRHSPEDGWKNPVVLERSPSGLGFVRPIVRMDASGRATAVWTRIVNLAGTLVTSSSR